MKPISSIFLALLLSACGRGEMKAQKETVASRLEFEIKGIALAAPIDTVDYKIFTALKRTGANSIAIMPYAFCTSDVPKVQYNSKRQWRGECSEGVVETIRMAHEHGISVMLKPHLWIGHGSYTGDLGFSSEGAWQEWQNSFRDYTLNFAQIAESEKVEWFCFGTEMGNVVKERPEFIKDLIDTLRKTYHGKLTYAANWNDFEEFPFWNQLDAIGVDAYFPLSEKPSPTLEELMKGWEKPKALLKAISIKHGKKVLVAEVGYRNADEATKEPWAESNKNKNDNLQAIAYQAFFQTFAAEPYILGTYLWKWLPDRLQLDNAQATDFTPQGKPAEKVIIDWYGKRVNN